MYPSMDPADQRAVPLEPGKTIEAEISEAGEEDLYKITIKNAANYTFQTRGSTDVVMQIYGPDSSTILVAEDDDGGTGLNSMIEAALQPGKYYIQIKHYSAHARGAYRILAFS